MTKTKKRVSSTVTVSLLHPVANKDAAPPRHIYTCRCTALALAGSQPGLALFFVRRATEAVLHVHQLGALFWCRQQREKGTSRDPADCVPRLAQIQSEHMPPYIQEINPLLWLLSSCCCSSDKRRMRLLQSESHSSCRSKNSETPPAFDATQGSCRHFPGQRVFRRTFASLLVCYILCQTCSSIGKTAHPA